MVFLVQSLWALCKHCTRGKIKSTFFVSLRVVWLESLCTVLASNGAQTPVLERLCALRVLNRGDWNPLGYFWPAHHLRINFLPYRLHTQYDKTCLERNLQKELSFWEQVKGGKGWAVSNLENVEKWFWCFLSLSLWLKWLLHMILSGKELRWKCLVSVCASLVALIECLFTYDTCVSEVMVQGRSGKSAESKE